MNLDKLNNLIELFSHQVEKQNKESIFLQWLNPNNKKSYTWEETQKNILKLSKIIRENIKEGDRCLLVSENRPEWFVSDMAIMLSGGITVPAYTTYTEDDYKYLIEDCEPSLIIVYFSAFKMVYDFENAAYNTAVGEISQPFKTQFGYHVVKVLDKRRSRGKAEAAHIMIANNSKDTTQTPEQRINEIHRLLLQGDPRSSLRSRHELGSRC